MISKNVVFSEIVHPREVEKSECNKFVFSAIYKGIYMTIRLLLQIRQNQNQIARKLGFDLIDDKPNKGENNVI